jgi:prepilin-type N-terminal cleavage/methylation domain-containing protein/prepilin-type processing-associated H-X9-DG protein
MLTPSALRSRFHAGFTLIELIVTVAIVSVLLGLLLPALRSVQRQAIATADLSNLRSLMQAHLAYMNIYHERFVDVGLPHGTPADPSLSFVHKLKPFLGSGTLAVKSPLDQSPHWQPEDGGDGTPVMGGLTPVWRQTSYGMNNYLSRTVSPWIALSGPSAASDCLAAIEKPHRMVCFLLMSELGSYASADHPHVEDWGSAPHPARQAAGQSMINAIDRNRPSTDSRSNYAFLDGHATAQRFDEVFKTSSDNQFDPEVQR